MHNHYIFIQKYSVMENLTPEKQAIKQGKKAIKDAEKSKESSAKAFTSMLTTTSRNHYMMSQMVDRKARIILTIDALVISLIIGKIIVNHEFHDFKFLLLVVAGMSALASIVYSMLEITPEETHGKLSTEDLNLKKGNPLFFGNFKNLRLADYKKAMASMSNNIEAVHNAIIEDIFYLGKTLEQKRKYLKYSLYILVSGICIVLLMAFVYRILYGDILVHKT